MLNVLYMFVDAHPHPGLVLFGVAQLRQAGTPLLCANGTTAAEWNAAGSGTAVEAAEEAMAAADRQRHEERKKAQRYRCREPENPLFGPWMSSIARRRATRILGRIFPLVPVLHHHL